jgi:hypothetical protein
MPGGDRTGPMGMGPMTGRGAGFCAGFPTPGFMRAGLGGAWFGRGRGGGRGWRNWFYATGLTGWQRAAMGGLGLAAASLFARPFASPGATEEQELDLLKQQAEQLSGALDEVKKRIDQLQKRAQKPT